MYGRSAEEDHNFFQELEPEYYSLRQMLNAVASISGFIALLLGLRIYIFKNPVKSISQRASRRCCRTNWSTDTGPHRRHSLRCKPTETEIHRLSKSRSSVLDFSKKCDVLENTFNTPLSRNPKDYQGRWLFLTLLGKMVVRRLNLW